MSWTDATGKTASIQLLKASQRRLLVYLLASKVRDVRGIPQAFIDGLAAAFVAAGDPAAPSVQQTVNPSASGPWKIQLLKIEGFGGVNIWNGKPFELAIEQQSLLIEGPNGSGKSSLIAAIIWALTGQRPRDQGGASLEQAMPVFDAHDRSAGAWPPVASYPLDSISLKTSPNVSVEVVFANPSGKEASGVGISMVRMSRTRSTQHFKSPPFYWKRDFSCPRECRICVSTKVGVNLQMPCKN